MLSGPSVKHCHLNAAQTNYGLEHFSIRLRCSFYFFVFFFVFCFLFIINEKSTDKISFKMRRMFRVLFHTLFCFRGKFTNSNRILLKLDRPYWTKLNDICIVGRVYRDLFAFIKVISLFNNCFENFEIIFCKINWINRLKSLVLATWKIILCKDARKLSAKGRK